MMDAPDTSTEAVERLARFADDLAALFRAVAETSADDEDDDDRRCKLLRSQGYYAETAATLRALAADRAAELAEAEQRGYLRGIEAAAQSVECDCRHAAEIVAAAAQSRNGAERWRLCYSERCSAIEAADIRALAQRDGEAGE